MALTKVIGDGLGGTNDLTVDTTTLTVDATNNRVGIGSATPTKVLDITESASADTGQLKLTYDGGDGNRAGFILKNTHTGGREYGIYAGNNSTGGGLGNSLGISDNTASTAYRLLIDSAGHVTMPDQPCFSATASIDNLALTTTITIPLSERFDVGSNVASNQFVAPVTGKYLFTYMLYFTNLDADHTGLDTHIKTSNFQYQQSFSPNLILSSDGNFSVSGSVLADMDLGDTCKFTTRVAGGANTSDIHADSHVSGVLIC